ncbi:MAG: hypothetical protein U0822_15785 [Anaerolineae bacterium]
MTQSQTSRTRAALRTPRAAAVAGILFALIYGTSLLLIRLSIPADRVFETSWLDANAHNVALGLNLIPYAGIAFLWFIGVIRDRLGELEDRFLATVFLGSGLLFLAMTFAGAALTGGLLTGYELEKQAMIDSGVFTYARASTYNVLNVYAIRMAGVFMMSLGTIWMRTRATHRFWPVLTYILALLLLITISFSVWVVLIFPVWVFAVSVYLLVRGGGTQPHVAAAKPDAA